MLNCHILPQPDLKSQVFERFLDQDVQWIVNDLETKFSLQAQLRANSLKKKSGLPVQNENQAFGFLIGEPVLRASELWQKLLLKVDPDWQVLSPQFAQFILEKWIQEILLKKDLKLSAKDFRKAYQTIGQILPLLSHFQGSEAMEEWFEENNEAQERWFDWYLLGKELWARFYEKKMIPQDWMKGVLINESFQSLTSNHYVFDLGFDIDDVESELIVNISRLCDVDVLIPDSESARISYTHLLQISQVQNYEKDDLKTKKVFKKLPTMLSEVKDAVGVIREWLDQEYKPEDLALVSPVIENYWPTLSEYLMAEGIPFDKKILTPLSQIEVYQNWLSRMRLALNEGSGLDGEQILYSQNETPPLSFVNYHSSFQNVYDISDFKRSDVVQKWIPEKSDKNQLISFDEFMEWSFSLAPLKDWESLREVFQSFDDAKSSKESLTRGRWFDFFEIHLSRSEKKIKDANPQGIHVLSVTAAMGRPLKKIYVLGLTENHLTENQNTSLHWRDIESIELKFGFSLN